jgi:O-antigen/teichoic acid export membrane protein
MTPALPPDNASATEEGSAGVERLARGTGISTLGKLVGRIALVGGQILVARLLAPEGFGLYSIGFNLARVLGQVSTLGLDYAVIRFTRDPARYEHTRRASATTQALTVATFAGLIGGMIMAIAGPHIARELLHKPRAAHVIVDFAPVVGLYALLKVTAASTRVHGAMTESVLAEDIGQPVIQIIAFVSMYALGLRLSAAVSAVAISYVSALLLALWFAMRMRILPRVSRLRLAYPPGRMMTYALTISLSSSAGLTMNWADTLVAARFLDARSVGIYQAVSQVPLVFSTIAFSVAAACAPLLVSHDGVAGTARNRALYRVGSKWALAVGVPAGVVMIAAPSTVAAVLLGSGYTSGADAMAVLAVGQLVNLGTGAGGVVLMMGGSERSWGVITAGAMLLSLILVAALTPHWGMDGTAAAVAIGVSGMSIAGAAWVRFRFGYWPYSREFGKVAMAALPTVAAVGALMAVGRNWPAFPLLTALTVTAYATWGGTLVALGLTDEDRQMIRGTFNRGPRAR